MAAAGLRLGVPDAPTRFRGLGTMTTPEEIAEAITKLSAADRMKVRDLVEEKMEICKQCWQDGDGWCCYDSKPDW